MSTLPLPLGKLPTHLLNHLIQQLPPADHTVIVPPGIGLDAAGLHLPQPLISVTTDPITFSTHELGTYSICVNINDIACTGSRPRWYTASLLLPPGTTEKNLFDIWNNLTDALKKYQIQAIGGHIEVTEAVNHPILVGQMIGEALGDTFLTPKHAQPGDQILLCRALAIEGTALLACEKATFLKNHLPNEALMHSQALLKEPGICIWPLVEPIIPTPGLIALHDPTEGGIATALHEWADATECGIFIDGDQIAIRPETQSLCQIFDIDPLGLLASGSLLILCRSEAEEKIRAKLPGEVITNIGQLTKTSERILKKQGCHTLLPRFQADEITKALKIV